MRLLIVDDDKDALADITSALEPAKYELVYTTDPLEAFQLYKQRSCDVVITDQRMPGMTGLELLKLIKEHDAEAKVILITAYGDLNTAVAAINKHAYAFFGKPVDFSELIQTLRTIEKECREYQKTHVDYGKLKDENDKLKQAYQELLNFVKESK